MQASAYAKNGGYRTNRYIVCSKEGRSKEIVTDYDRKREKTSKRTGCKAGMSSITTTG